MKLHFLEIPPIPCFHFDSAAQNENTELAGTFSISLTYKNFYQT